jgi:hypothetical protein
MAEVRGGANAYRVSASEEGVFSGLDELYAQIAPVAPRTAFETWANERAEREDSSVSSRYVSNDVIGHEDLDDYGDWLHEPSYGYVWRPRYVSHDWAPYRFGQWVWVSPWGWTWLDDARWGFAPFHYGRWAQVQNRWCWVPGPRHVRPVYAPALVGWTGGAPLGVFDPFERGMRWFPLAPREVYVPGYRHTPRHIRRFNQSNTIVDDDSRIARAHTQRARDGTYRYRADSNAVPVASQDRVTSERPIRDQRARAVDRRVSDREQARRQREQVGPEQEQVRREQARYNTRRDAPARPSAASPSAAAQQSTRPEAADAPQTRSSTPQVAPSSPQNRPSPAQAQPSAPAVRRSTPASAATSRRGNVPAQL